ncbi:ATP-binding protein [Candidatus Thiosymbion oneisti]|uniref:ATP-binding protein n=1 Tax=Candidatus Thiosymbion oneisti TaxID=589554 RepID=UPI00105D20C4|nr:ATP-binding protein [Candidatus Thiosymbion oneisti]
MRSNRFPAIFERIKQCPANEHEQGYLRLFLVSTVSLYIYVLAVHPQVTFEVRDKETVKQAISIIYPIFAAYALVFFYWLYRQPVKVPVRRILSNFIDLLSLSIVMYLSDDWGSVLYPVYLWIIIGSAFRFGSVYLLISAILSILMFTVVILTTPFWLEHPTISIGLLSGLFILPPYIGLLLKQKGEALRKAEIASYKERFLSAISHELRTPLQSVIALSELSLEAAHRDNAPDYMRQVNGAAQHLLSLINDVLDFSKAENAKLKLGELPFDVRKLVAAVESLILPQAKSKHLVFKVDIASDVPDSVIGDELRIRQILINLSSNAVKYTESGEIILAVQVLELNDKSVRLQFSVEDTGIGIKADDIGKVFQSFVQVHSNNNNELGVGSGLGLALSKRLVKLMGGKITIASEYGKGSRFTFDVKLPWVTLQSIAIPTQDDDRTTGDDLSGLRILIAEDEELLQSVYRRIFKTSQCRLTIVDDGEAALQALRTQPYDLAILDYQIPFLNGLELAVIWRREEQGSRMPILLLTANAEVVSQGESSDNVELIRIKPIIPSDLIRDVKYLTALTIKDSDELLTRQ